MHDTTMTSSVSPENHAANNNSDARGDITTVGATPSTTAILATISPATTPVSATSIGRPSPASGSGSDGRDSDSDMTGKRSGRSGGGRIFDSPAFHNPSHHGHSPASDHNTPPKLSSSSSHTPVAAVPVQPPSPMVALPPPAAAAGGESLVGRRENRAMAAENRLRAASDLAASRRASKEYDPDRYNEEPSDEGSVAVEAAEPRRRGGKPKSASTLEREKTNREQTLLARKRRRENGEPEALNDILSDDEFNREQDLAASTAASAAAAASGSFSDSAVSDAADDDDDAGEDGESDAPNNNTNNNNARSKRRRKRINDDDDNDVGNTNGAEDGGVRGAVREVKRRMKAQRLAAQERHDQIIPEWTGADDQEDDDTATARAIAEEQRIQNAMHDIETQSNFPPPNQAANANMDYKHPGAVATATATAAAAEAMMVDVPGVPRGSHMVDGSGDGKTAVPVVAPLAAATAVKEVEVRRWPVPLNGEQEKLKAQWKSLWQKQKQQSEAKAFGVAQSTIDLSTLTADQISAVLLRPLSDDATPMYLKARLHLWLQIVRLIDSHIDEGVQRANYLFYRLQTIPELEERHMALFTAVERIRELMSRNNMLDIRNPAGRELNQEIDAVQNNVDSLMMMKLIAVDLMRGTKAHCSKIARLATMRSSQQQLQQDLADAREKWSTFAQVLDKILDRAQEWKLVRVEGQVYHPVMNDQHQWTRCYQQWQNGEILEFVHRAASLKQHDPKLYGMLYDRGTYWKQIVEILKYTYDDRFPEVQPSRYWYAFSNGIYNIQDDRFYEYGSLGFKHLPEEVVCCSYFNQVFDNAEYEWHMKHGPDKKDPWYNIPTPHLDKICETQRWKRGERKWWYAGGGRMLFPLNELENWGKMWIHLGRAGCGKTTFLKYVAGYFPRFKVGIINNNCEKIFTIQHLEKTWSWFGFDIKENWNLDQTLWNTMVDGGMLTLARKYLSSKLTDFLQHGAIASNRLMNWPDLNGQLLRRLFPHIYRRLPDKYELLAREMETERAAALKKFACGYRAKAAKHKVDQLTEDILPKGIRESLAIIRREANPLMAFLESDKIVLHPDYYMERRRFVREFSSYAVEIGIRGAKSLPSVNDAFFADVLDAKNLKIANDYRKVPVGLSYGSTDHNGNLIDHAANRESKRQMWIVGCALRESETQQPAYRPEINAQNGFQPTSSSSANASSSTNASAAPSSSAAPAASAALSEKSRGSVVRSRMAGGGRMRPSFTQSAAR